MFRTGIHYLTNHLICFFVSLLLMTKSSSSTSTCHRKDLNETTPTSSCDVRPKYYSSNVTTDFTDEKELRKRLTPLQYHVTQEKGTESPFTGCYNDMSRRGNYSCVVCDIPLFSSDTKFNSHCGWPAFSEALDRRVKLTSDTSHDMIRIEVTCSKCNAHLGHMFMDGPPPTRKRFCINSASLNFHPTVE